MLLDNVFSANRMLLVKLSHEYFHQDQDVVLMELHPGVCLVTHVNALGQETIQQIVRPASYHSVRAHSYTA